MTHSKNSVIIVTFAIASFLITSIAFAKNQGDDHEKGGNKHGQKYEDKREKYEDKAERKVGKNAEKRQREDIKQGAYFNDQPLYLSNLNGNAQEALTDQPLVCCIQNRMRGLPRPVFERSNVYFI